MTLYNHIKIFQCNLELSVEAITMHCISRVIIYQRSHNLPINNDSPSHYLLGNFDWGDILGGPLLTVTAPIWQFNLSGLRLFATLLFVLLYSLKCCTVLKHLNNIYLKLRKLILRLIMIHVTLHVFTSL